jgi:hypothetical protein
VIARGSTDRGWFDVGDSGLQEPDGCTRYVAVCEGKQILLRYFEAGSEDERVLFDRLRELRVEVCDPA